MVCMLTFVCTLVHIYMCMLLCMYMYGSQRSVLHAFLDCCLLTNWTLLLNLKHVDLGSLFSGNPLSLLPELWDHQVDHQRCLAFIWVLGFLTPVLTHAQKILCQLRHRSTPEILLKDNSQIYWKDLVCCIHKGIQVETHTRKDKAGPTLHNNKLSILNPQRLEVWNVWNY